MPKGVKIHDHQSQWNLALQHYGSVDGMDQFFANGTFKGFDDVPVPGKKIVPGDPVNKTVADFYREKGIVVATRKEAASQLQLDGEFNDDFNDDFNQI